MGCDANSPEKTATKKEQSLELELVEAVAPGETPRGLEVLAQVVDLLDGCEKSRVDGLYESVSAFLGILWSIPRRAILSRPQFPYCHLAPYYASRFEIE